MSRVSKKQKIIVIILVSIVLVGFYYYTYIRKNNFSIDEKLKIEDMAEKGENSSKTKIKIHILGAVNTEGLVELDEESRIADAVEAAGGFTENACTSEVNLACLLEDGMQIRIPTNEEILKEKENSMATEQEVNFTTNKNGVNKESTVGVTSKGSTVGITNKANAKININTASQSELERLPGIGEATATKIIAYRNENGKFKEITEIKNVKGIGESKFNLIKDLITI